MPKQIVIRGNQPGQQAFLDDWAVGWVLYEAGLGAGKTWAAARKFLLLHAHNKCPGLMSAPTIGDLFRFCVPEIRAACAEWNWPCKIFPKGRGEYPFPHFVVWGQIIYLISAEDPSRFAGFEVGHIWVDEGARCKQNHIDPLRDAPTQIRTRLRSKEAKLLQGIVSTTPEGTETWIQDFWTDNPKPNHRRYSGTTEKNNALPQEYINDLKASIPAHLINQYMNGIAASVVEGIAHPTFTLDNVSTRADWSSTTTHIGMDFNVAPLAWVAFQEVGEYIYAVDELFIEDFALVDDGMHAIKDKGWGDGKIVFHPDKASKQRSTTGDAEFTVIVQKAREWGWNWSGTAAGVNPAITSRINNFSRLLCNAVGHRKLLIHPRCVRLIEDLQRTTRKKSGGYEPGPKNKRGHILDAGGYALFDMCSPKARISMATIV